MVDTNFRLGLYEARVMVPVQTLAAGTHQFKFGQPAGNSLLSTIYVRAIDPGASVKVNYFDFGPGDGSEPGERINLAGHPLVSAGDEPISDRRIISQISNKPVLEIIVLGGAAEVGVHIAVVSDFPIELNGPILDGQTASLGTDGGLPPSIYDPSDGKFYLVRGTNGVMQVTPVANLTTPIIELATIAVANTQQAHAFPANTKTFLIRSRSGSGRIKLAHTSGGPYLTINPGVVYKSPDFNRASTTIFLESPTAGLEIELESWS